MTEGQKMTCKKIISLSLFFKNGSLMVDLFIKKIAYKEIGISLLRYRWADVYRGAMQHQRGDLLLLVGSQEN